jgi:hypothetical protein
MSAYAPMSTTGKAPLVFSSPAPGLVRVDLEDGSTQDYPVDAFREVYRRVVKIPAARQVITELFRKYLIDDPNQARRLVRERFSEDDRQAYVAALKVLMANGELG